MAGFPTGVAVVTSIGPAGQPWGMTCSSVCSVALSPPTLLVCLRRGSPTLSAVLHSGAFAVNLLHEGAQSTAALFASGLAERFTLVNWEAGPGCAGPHLRDGVHAVADCRVNQTETVGDHTVVFGEVDRVSLRAQHPPLLYGLRQYARWPSETT
jgi:flavin reductase (DIM6/NTAB) family NADH-FMN oxidoreductase RutF